MIDYSKFLSPKATSLKPSGIRKFFDILEEMDDVVSLTVGQPDFDTPWHIREEGIESLKQGKTYYTSNSGTMELREEISAYLARRFSLSYDPKNEVIVTVGGSEAIDLAIRALISDGDEAVIVSPSFVCYSPLVTLAGGVPVNIPTREEDDFKLTPESLEKAITPKTKLLVLPFPNNPTGAIMEKCDLEKIIPIIIKHDIMVLSDEIYAELTYGSEHISVASFDGMRERTVVASGFSKAYAMNGWRLGYVCAPREITEQMLKIHQFQLMCASTTSQCAGIKALRDGDEDVAYMADQYNGRRRVILDGLRSIGIPCFEPKGAFYVFPNLKKFGLTSEEFCEKLLFDYKVAIVPGNAFGECGEGFARISYAYSLNHINRALEMMKKFVDTL